MRWLTDLADDAPGLFMWLVVLPLICGLYLLLAWLLGWPPVSDPNALAPLLS